MPGPRRGPASASRFACAWIDHGFGFAVAATASRDELMPIAEAIYRGLTPKG
jgi:anti-sigma factor RsiW